MKPVIAVVGATGRQGGSVVDALIQSGQWTVRGLTRNLQSSTSQELIQRGVEMVSCNIDSLEDCQRAFRGAYGVFAMTNYWECGAEKEYEQGMNMVKAAHAEQVQHFIWSTAADTMAISNGKIDLPYYTVKARVEAYIRAQQDPPLFPFITFLNVGFYYQNFLTSFPLNEKFEFRVPLHSNARLPLYDVQDTGAVVARCFADPDRWGKGNFIPVVAEHLTMDEICQTIRRVTGNEKVQYVPVTYEQCEGRTEEWLNNMRWYNEFGAYEQRRAEKTREIYDQMKKLEDWIRESKWLSDKN